jgi:FMN phosphatase YigB (HAD superfamily)
MSKKTVILFDIDHTIFNTVTFVDKVYKKNFESLGKAAFLKLLEETKADFKKALGEKGSIKSNIANALLDQAGLSDDFHKETVEILGKLSKLATLGILSKGDENFQKKKIESIVHFFAKEHIHITSNKLEILPEIVKEYKNDKLIIVDDMLEVLITAKKLNKSIVVVWVKRGPFAKKQLPIENFTPDLTVDDLSSLDRIIGYD